MFTAARTVSSEAGSAEDDVRARLAAHGAERFTKFSRRPDRSGLPGGQGRGDGRLLAVQTGPEGVRVELVALAGIDDGTRRPARFLAG